MRRFPIVAAGVALSLVFAGEAAAQDVTPPMSRDTTKAEKPRTDTLQADTTRGYRAMATPTPCVVPADVASARDAAKLEPGRDAARADTMGPAIIRRDSIPGKSADSAAAPGAIQEQRAEARAADVAAGVPADSAKPGVALPSEIAQAQVNCDTMGQMTPGTPVDTAKARELPGLMGKPAPGDSAAGNAADKPKDELDKPKDNADKPKDAVEAPTND